jgi:hypothetical protein
MSAENPSQDNPSQPVAKRGSLLRLGILLILLAAVVGALGYDYLIAKPAMVAAADRLQVVVDERLKQSVDGGERAKSADVQKAIGFPPTITERRGDNVIEWYCWWGKTPWLSTRRSYLWVKYEGPEPQHVSTFDYETSPDDSLANPAAPSEPVPGKMGHGDSRPKKQPDQPPASDVPADETPAAPVGGTSD